MPVSKSSFGKINPKAPNLVLGIKNNSSVHHQGVATIILYDFLDSTHFFDHTASGLGSSSTTDRHSHHGNCLSTMVAHITCARNKFLKTQDFSTLGVVFQ